MEIRKCQFCEHGNSMDAKYCSNCGGCLFLVPCPSCGAVNDVKAVSCYQCQAPLHAGAMGDTQARPAPVAMLGKPRSPDILSRALEVGKLEAVYPMPPAGTAPMPLYRRRVPFIAGTAVLALIAGLGYYGYRHQTLINAAAPPAAGGGTPARSSPGSAGVIRHDTAVVETAPVNAAGATRAAAPPARVTRESAVSAAAPVASPGDAAAAACSGAATTLGLCATQSDQIKQTEAAAGAVGASSARDDAKAADAAEGAMATENTKARTDSCTAAAAALGLCVPTAAGAAVPAVTHTRRSE